MPDAELWQSPIAWGGVPLRPIENYSRPLPMGAVFVRGNWFSRSDKQIAPGMTSQSERALPGLIRLERGKPVEVYVRGLDDRCWTYQLVRKGKVMRRELFMGESFPATEPVAADDEQKLGIVWMMLQSLLPIGSSNGYVSLMFKDDHTIENFSKAIDPDQGD